MGGANKGVKMRYEKHKEDKNHLDFRIDLFCTDISTICVRFNEGGVIWKI